MIFELTLSRYLVKPLFSILLGIGATIGVACLLIVLSLFENYYLSMEKVFMGIHPHIQILMTDDKTDKEIEPIISQLKANYPEITLIGPALYEKVKVEIAHVTVKKSGSECISLKLEGVSVCEGKTDVEIEELKGFDISKKEIKEVFLKGISVQDNQTVMAIKNLISGQNDLNRLTLTKNENGYPIPAAFYMEGLSPDLVLDDFLLSQPEHGKKQHYRFMGLLDIGRKTGRLPLLIVSLSNAQQLLNKPSKINTIEIRLLQPYHSPKIANKMQTDLGEGFKVQDWTEKEQASFAFLNLIKKITFSLLFSISVVAAISVYSTLLLAVMQNRKKIAILKALGIKNKSIYLIFVSSAVKIGVIGLIAGSLIGYVGSECLIAYFSDSLQDLGLKNPQTEISGSDLLLTTILTLMLFTFTALIPAWKAVTMETVDNLQT